MAELIEIVAQYAEDAYYGDYKSDSQFFDLKDFEYHCAKEAGEVLRQEFNAQYQMLRQEKEDAVVDLSDDWTEIEIIDVTSKDGLVSGTMKSAVFSLPFDSQNSFIQDIYPIDNRSCLTFERTTSGAIWRLRYVPVSDRIFWYPQTDGNCIQIVFYNSGTYNIGKVKVEYVPSISDLKKIPAGMVSIVITNAVLKMKELDKGNVVKKALDQNINKVLETEIDKRQLP